jgi:hypothetical protein
MDLAKVAISSVLYFVPPPVILKLKPAILTVVGQLSTFSGSSRFYRQSEQLDFESDAPSAGDGEGCRTFSTSLLSNTSNNPDPNTLQLESQLRKRRTTISVTVEGGDGANSALVLNYSVPPNAKSVNVSFQEPAPGCLGVQFALSSDYDSCSISGGSNCGQDTWRGIKVQGAREGNLERSRLLPQDVVTYLELLYCVFFVGGWFLKAMGPILEWAKSASRVALGALIHLGASWLAKVLRLILASLPAGV